MSDQSNNDTANSEIGTNSEAPASNPTNSPENSTAAAIRSVSATVIGLILLLFAVVVIIPDEAEPNGTMLALGALIGALGAGMLASALLPHKIEVGGEKVQPFGMDVKASGGSAVFVLALAFFYFSNAQTIEAGQKTGEAADPQVAQAEVTNPAEGPAPDPQSEAQEPEVETPAGPDANEPPFDSPEFESDIPELDETLELNVPQGAPPTYVPTPGYLNNPYNETYSLAPGLVMVRTYCNSCCPGGPQMCAQAGGAASYNLQEARDAAVFLCAQRAGNPANCKANVEQF